MNRELLVFVCVATALGATGCEPDLSGVFSSSSSSSSGGAGGQGGVAGPGGAAGEGGSWGGSGGSVTTSTTTTGGGGCDSPDPGADQDMDGYTPAQGDCNDCAPEINPNALEIPGGGDENCNGQTDDTLAACDETIAVDTALPVEAAGAIDLCKVSMGDGDWGIYAAAWSLPDGAPVPAGSEMAFHLGHGVLADFGPQVPPRGGKRVLVLSSGTARTPDDPGYQALQGYSKGYSCAPAPGFPKETASCNGVTTGMPQDAAVLNVGLRVPSNVHGISYDFSFYAYDFPQYVCSTFNDTFFAIFEPYLSGQPDGNVATDELGNPVTLNAANFRACSCQGGPPCTAGGNKMYQCALGDAPLLGTGFDQAAAGSDRGATGWLTTTVPVEPGSTISLRWGVYDAGDAAFDSSVVLDHWQWLTTPGVVYETKISP